MNFDSPDYFKSLHSDVAKAEKAAETIDTVDDKFAVKMQELLDEMGNYRNIIAELKSAESPEEIRDVILKYSELALLTKENLLNVFSQDMAEASFVRDKLIELLTSRFNDRSSLIESELAQLDVIRVQEEARLSQFNDSIKRRISN